MTDHNHPPRCTCPGVPGGGGSRDGYYPVDRYNPECRMHGTDQNRHPHYRQYPPSPRVFTGPTDRVGIPTTRDPVTGYVIAHIPPARAVSVEVGEDPNAEAGPCPVCRGVTGHLDTCVHLVGLPSTARVIGEEPELDDIATAEDLKNYLEDHPLESLLSAIERHGHSSTAPRARKILERVADLVNGPRNSDYGDARDNFAETGRLWAPILGLDEVTAEQVALCMGQVKVARLIHNPTHADSWDDGVGYMALGGGIAEQTREETDPDI